MKTSTNNQKGVIMLFTILGVGSLALGAALTVAIGSLTELAKNRNTISGDQVFYTGEAAVSEGAYRYLSASSFAATAGQAINNTATSTVEVIPLSWPYVKARGRAANARTHRGVVRVITLYPEGLAFDYAVYAQNDLAFGGNMIVNGNVFANNGIDGGNSNGVEINGDAFTPEDIDDDKNNIEGMSVTGVNPIPPPVIELDPYRDAALAALPSTYFATSSDAVTYVHGNSLDNVIIFIDDEDTEAVIGNSNTAVTGSIAKVGDLHLKGGIYSAIDTYVAIYVTGDLRITGGTTINGIVYVTGNTSFGGGNNVINGSLISAGGASVTDLTGTMTINFDPSVYDTWPSLTGLNTTSTSAPEIILWEEE